MEKNTDTVKGKVVKNVASTVALNLVNMLVFFLSRVVFVYVFGEYYLGINGLFTNLLSILSLADLGISTALMFSLYKPLVEKDEEKIVALISYFRRIFFFVALAVVLLGLALMPFLRYIINMDTEIAYVEIYYLIALLTTASTYLFIYRVILIKADQKAYIVNKIQSIYNVISFIIQLILIWVFQNYMLYSVAVLVLGILGNFVINKKAYQMYPYLKNTATQLNKNDRKEITKNFSSLFIYKFCSTIQTNTDSILTSIYVGTVVVGYYSNYALIFTYMMTFLTILFDNVKASIGNMIATDDNKENHFVFYKILDYVNFWLITFISVAMLVMLDEFIEMLFGENYVFGFAVTLLIVLNFYKSNIRHAIWVFRETAGLFMMTKYITLTSAILNLIFSIILGYFWQLEGIIIATILSHYVYAWWKEPVLIFKQYFNVSPKYYFTSYMLRIGIMIIAFLLTFGACYYINMPNIFLDLLVKGVICLIIPNVVIIACTFKTNEFKYFNDNFITPALIKLKLKK